jgi:transcriptional regulator with XRE-family HTH domain
MDITDQIKHVSQRLREEREKLRISQMDLSFKAGLSQNQVNYIETGNRKKDAQFIYDFEYLQCITDQPGSAF